MPYNSLIYLKRSDFSYTGHKSDKLITIFKLIKV